MRTKNLFALLIATISLGNVYSQNDTNVIFYDFTPDTILSNQFDTLKIDIDQNSIMDVAFYLQYTSGGDYAYAISVNNNVYYAYLYSSFNTDSLTYSGLNWLQSYFYWNSYYCPEKIGIKIIVGSDNYYGWIKGTNSYVNGHKIITLDKYAFCKIPNYPLLWGQTETITNVSGGKMGNQEDVFISQRKDIISINSIIEIKMVTVRGISGTEILTKTGIYSKSAEINMGNLANGVYVVSIELTDGNVYAKQIVK